MSVRVSVGGQVECRGGAIYERKTPTAESRWIISKSDKKGTNGRGDQERRGIGDGLLVLRDKSV